MSVVYWLENTFIVDSLKEELVCLNVCGLLCNHLGVTVCDTGEVATNWEGIFKDWNESLEIRLWDEVVLKIVEEGSIRQNLVELLLHFEEVLEYLERFLKGDDLVLQTRLDVSNYLEPHSVWQESDDWWNIDLCVLGD